MNEMPLTDDQCDRLVAKVMDKLAAKHSDQYGATHAMDLNPSITEHHTLRCSVVQAAYMLGALEMQQSEREQWRKAVDGLGMLRTFLAGWKQSEACKNNEMQTQVQGWMDGINELYRLYDLGA